MNAARVPLTLTTDLDHGGRWTSLRSAAVDGGAGGREWLWRNPAVPAEEREVVRPRRTFVDAGGGEECFPSVTGAVERGHDHGDVWSRPWTGSPTDARVAAGALGLRRRVRSATEVLRLDYELTGPVGTGVLHAVHLLLDLSTTARLEVPGTPDAVLQDRPAAGDALTRRWPDGDGVALDRLGPDDDTARVALVRTDAVAVVDGRDRLELRWGPSAPDVAPVSLLVFRNLRGWPEPAPYRSVAIEPLLGAALDRDRAADDEVAVLGAGPLRWWLELRASTTGAPAVSQAG